MPGIKSLYLLLQSLDNDEKRNFIKSKGFGKAKKSYMVLFDMIDNCKVNINKIKAEFEIRLPGSNFQVSLNHLYFTLLQHFSESNPDIEDLLLEKIRQIRFLIRKGLLENALSLTRKYSEIALKFEKHDYLLLLYSLEFKIIELLEFDDLSEEKLISFQDTVKNAMNHKMSVASHLSLYQILLHRLLNLTSGKEDVEMNDLLVSEYNIMLNPRYNSFEAERLHLLFQSVYFMNRGNFNASLQLFQNLIGLFDANPLKWKNNPGVYIDLISEILNNLRLMRKYEEIAGFISKLEILELKDINDRQKQRYLLFVHKNLNHIDIGAYQKAFQIMDSYDFHIDKDNLCLLPSRRAVIMILRLVTLIATGYYREGNRLLNSLLKEEFKLPEIYIQPIAMLSIIIRLQLGLSGLVRYELSSLERRIRKRGINNFDSLFLGFFKELIKTESKHENRVLIEKYRPKFSETIANQRNVIFLKYFDFMLWLAACISGKTMQEAYIELYSK
jgi:hypothetical protein